MPHTVKLSPPAKPSSLVHATGHDPARKLLVVQFNGPNGTPGRKYAYPHVTAEQYADLTGADSIGKHFNATIRGSVNHPHYEVKS